MKEEILQKINQSINQSVKEKARKNLIIDIGFFKEISKNLKEIVLRYEEIKNIFPQNQELLEYSGDILFNTFRTAWYTRQEKFLDLFEQEVDKTLTCQVAQPASVPELAP